MSKVSDDEMEEMDAVSIPDELDDSLKELVRGGTAQCFHVDGKLTFWRLLCCCCRCCLRGDVQCITQGFSPDKLLNRAHTVTKLDCFQAFRTHCDVVQYFGNLKEVIFVQLPRVDALIGFENCPKLERLFVSECKVKAIGTELRRCTRLKTLCLNSNQIRMIEGLDTLVNLETLFLCDNHITSLRGLENLRNLKTLFIARNRVERIGTCLDALVNLTDLNLADNRVGYFKEIHNLTRLPSLTTLCLNEPHYGDNPVCNLCNYQTYVLYQLANLTCLDTLFVSEDAKALAEATYIKKKMYYNMRIKTLKRNTTNVVRRAAEALQARVGQINLNFNVLLRQMKEVQRLVEERDVSESAGAAAVGGVVPQGADSSHFWTALANKHSVLNDAIQTRGDEVTAIEDRFNALKERLTMISQQNITRMVVELGTGGAWAWCCGCCVALFGWRSTRACAVCVCLWRLCSSRFGVAMFCCCLVVVVVVAVLFVVLFLVLLEAGNIRLEDGKPSDVWYSSCVELLHSRFFERDFHAMGIKGVKVHRVTRVHNRFLRNRFDKRMSIVLGRNQSLTAGSSGSSKPPRRSLEYLFFTAPCAPLTSPTVAASSFTLLHRGLRCRVCCACVRVCVCVCVCAERRWCPHVLIKFSPAWPCWFHVCCSLLPLCGWLGCAACACFVVVLRCGVVVSEQPSCSALPKRASLKTTRSRRRPWASFQSTPLRRSPSGACAPSSPPPRLCCRFIVFV